MATTTPVTKMEAAYSGIRAAIEQGRYQPGDRLPLHRLISDLGMSPTPIREALRSLATEGLIELEPHRGAVVATYSPDKAAEAYMLRLALEPLAAELAAQRATTEQLARIRGIHDRLERLVSTPPITSEAPQLNAAWHRAIHEAAGSRLLLDFVDRVWRSIPVEALWMNRRAPGSVADHAEVTAALERRDGVTASRLIREHIAKGAAAAEAHLRKEADEVRTDDRAAGVSER